MQPLFHLGKVDYFVEHLTLPGEKFDDWSCVQLVTDTVEVLLHYQNIRTPMVDHIVGNDDDVQNICMFYVGPNEVTNNLIYCLSQTFYS